VTGNRIVEPNGRSAAVNVVDARRPLSVAALLSRHKKILAEVLELGQRCATLLAQLQRSEPKRLHSSRQTNYRGSMARPHGTSGLKRGPVVVAFFWYRDRRVQA